MKQEMTRWQWHQLDHMQINCTSLQTDNHARQITVIQFFTDRMLFLTPTNSVKALKATKYTHLPKKSTL